MQILCFVGEAHYLYALDAWEVMGTIWIHGVTWRVAHEDRRVREHPYLRKTPRHLRRSLQPEPLQGVRSGRGGIPARARRCFPLRHQTAWRSLHPLLLLLLLLRRDLPPQLPPPRLEAAEDFLLMASTPPPLPHRRHHTPPPPRPPQLGSARPDVTSIRSIVKTMRNSLSILEWVMAVLADCISNEKRAQVLLPNGTVDS